MNTTPDSNPTAAPPPAGGFFAWIRNLGIVRSNDRWFTGVAGGIAAKANIDPLIVRGVFVVLALLGGPGLLLYLIGWLLLPDTQGRIHAEEIIRGRAQSGVFITAIVIAAFVFIPVLFGILLAAPFTMWGWDGWGIIGVPDWLSATIAWVCWIAILVFAGIWLRRVLLERGRRVRAEAAGASAADPSVPFTDAGRPSTTEGAEVPVGAASAPASGSIGDPPTDAPHTGVPPTAGTSRPADDWSRRVSERAEHWGEQAGAWGEKAGAWGEKAGEAAGRWGENLGKQADDWSVKLAEQHEARRLGAAHTIITIALALLAGGAAAFWVSSSGAFADVTLGAMTAPSPTPVAVVAALVAALVVFAISLIVAGIRGRSTGWVGFLSACGVVALLFTAVLPWGTRFQPFGTLDVSSLHEPGAVLLAGSARINLSDLDETTAPEATQSATSEATPGVDLVLWQLTGNATVTMPAEHPTVVTVYMLAGNIGEQNGDETRNAAGPFISKRVAANLDSASSTASEATHVEVYMLAGNVRVVGSSENSGLSNDSELSEEAQRNIEADTRSSDSATLQKQRDLEDDLERVAWQLDEPGLSATERQSLETQQDLITRDLERLDKEVAR